MAIITEEDLDDSTDQNNMIIEEVVDDNHDFMMSYGLINIRPMISKMINPNHNSLIILDFNLLNGFTYLPFVIGGTLKFGATITPTSTYVTNPPVSELVDRQVLSVIHLPFDENTGAPGEMLNLNLNNSIANSSSNSQLKLQRLKLAEVTDEDLHFFDHLLSILGRRTQTLDGSTIPTSCYGSTLPVTKLDDEDILTMVILPCDMNTGYPIVPIPIANNIGRNHGNGNGDNSRGSGSGNGGNNGRDGGNAANNPLHIWFPPINIHMYVEHYSADLSRVYRKKVGSTIVTNIVPSNFPSWESFAGAIYQFSTTQIDTKSPIITNYHVSWVRGIGGMHPRRCWPAFEPHFGVFADGVFYCFNYLVYPWRTVRWLIRDVVVISLITRLIG